MKQMTKAAILSLLMIILLACSRQSNTTSNELENQFSTAVPLTDINKSLQMAVDSKDTFFESGADISILIYNRSSYSIYFDNNSYIKLLITPDNLHWLKIENEITYHGAREVLPKGTPLLDFVHTDVKPLLKQTDLDPATKNTLLRIVTVGEIMKDGKPTGQNVGAYVDVTLKP